MRILISGASISGPVAAYWLTRHGFDVTVVERAPQLRKTGGHAVDLFRPAMEISEKMGVLPQIEALATGTNRLTIHREGHRRAAEVDIGCGAADHPVESCGDEPSRDYNGEELSVSSWPLLSPKTQRERRNRVAASDVTGLAV